MYSNLFLMSFVIVKALTISGADRPEGVRTWPTIATVNGSSIDGGLKVESSKDIKVEGDNIYAMMAQLRGNNDGGDSNPAEYKFGDYDQRSHSSEPIKFDWHLKLDQSDRYQLAWSVDYPGNQITFGLGFNQSSSDHFQEGNDIFALGFSENGQLESSDFCILWYDLGHRLHLQDARTDAHNRLMLIPESRSVCKHLAPPSRHEFSSSSSSKWLLKRSSLSQFEPPDESQDDKEDEHNFNDLPLDDGGSGEGVTGEQLGRSLEIVFKRPLDVCVSERPYYTIDNGTTHLVWFALRGPVLSLDGLNLAELKWRRLERQARESKATEVGWNEAGFSFGMKRVQLIASKSDSTMSRSENGPLGGSVAPHGSRMDIRMEKFEIPAQETTYWCKLFKLPRKFESRKYHITRYEAIVEQGNEHVVHHMELFNCANLDAKQEFELRKLYEGGGWQGNCNGRERPEVSQTCKRVILAWAMGAHPLEYPDQVGQTIGGPGYSPYVVLEVHYNNVASQLGLVDSSGLRFHSTSRLRPYDAGILEVGLEYTDKNSIPPGLITPMAGHCASECTRAAMSGPGGRAARAGAPARPRHRVNTDDGGSGKLSSVARAKAEIGDGSQGGSSEHDDDSSVVAATNSKLAAASEAPGKKELDEGIYIFAAQMHTHLAGVASWTELVRGGQLVAELQRDNHYSPHFQEIRLLPEPVHLAPGDALIHYCLYDTRKRPNITLGGFATSDEMCVTYLHYYPRIDLEVCKSSVDTRALEAYFAYLAREEAQKTSEHLKWGWQEDSKFKITKNDQAKAKTVSENYQSIEWSRRRSQELMQFYASAPLSIQCNSSGGHRLPGSWEGITPTNVWPDTRGGGGRTGPPYVGPLSTASGPELVAYRGRGFGRRHAQCEVRN